MFSISPHVRPPSNWNGRPQPSCPDDPPATGEPAPPPGGHPPAAAGHQILRCGAAAAASPGLCFGASFALSQQWRAGGGPLRKVASSWLIVGAAALTAYAEPLCRQWTGARPTPWPRPSLSRDAVMPSVLLTTNLLYLYSRLPKYPGGSPRSWAANLLLGTLGCGMAGALNEALASREARRGGGEPARPRSQRQVATGRALSLVPMAMVQQIPAALLLNMRTVPPALAPVPIIVGTGGWAFRRLLAPATDSMAHGAWAQGTRTPPPGPDRAA
jgi:hypothetical protein